MRVMRVLVIFMLRKTMVIKIVMAMTVKPWGL